MALGDRYICYSAIGGSFLYWAQGYPAIPGKSSQWVEDVLPHYAGSDCAEVLKLNCGGHFELGQMREESLTQQACSMFPTSPQMENTL